MHTRQQQAVQLLVSILLFFISLQLQVSEAGVEAALFGDKLKQRAKTTVNVVKKLLFGQPSTSSNVTPPQQTAQPTAGGLEGFGSIRAHG